MAYDERLFKVTEKYVDVACMYGYGSQSEKVFDEYLEVLKVVAVERGDSVIEMESPFDSIIEFVMDDDLENANVALDQFRKMTESLESVGYSLADRWRKDYECAKKYVEQGGVE